MHAPASSGHGDHHAAAQQATGHTPAALVNQHEQAATAAPEDSAQQAETQQTTHAPAGTQHPADAHAAPAQGETHAHPWEGHYSFIHSEKDLPTADKRFFSNLLINGFIFTGVALLGLFFITVHHVANGGWYVQLQRIAESMGYWLFIGPVILLIVYFVAGDSLYMWLNPEAIQDPEVRALVTDKAAWWLSDGFFVARHLVFFSLWILLFWLIRRSSLREDTLAGKQSWIQRNKLSSIYILVFALTFSAASWDWLMSVETTWFSTMFAVRTFSSAWVMALAIITLVAVFLKQAGYMPTLSPSIFHDLGKYLFGFSIFWTYIWFCEFLLIWYANIPEEGIYFYNRLGDYGFSFGLMAILNFLLPFLVLMTNQSKRSLPTLVFVSCVLLLGHWVDFYLMVMPGSMGPFGEIGLLELGMFITFLGAFLFVLGTFLAKKPLMPKNHPYLEESLGHHYDI